MNPGEERRSSLAYRAWDSNPPDGGSGRMVRTGGVGGEGGGGPTPVEPPPHSGVTSGLNHDDDIRRIEIIGEIDDEGDRRSQAV